MTSNVNRLGGKNRLPSELREQQRKEQRAMEALIVAAMRGITPEQIEAETKRQEEAKGD